MTVCRHVVSYWGRLVTGVTNHSSIEATTRVTCVSHWSGLLKQLLGMNMFRNIDMGHVYQSPSTPLLSAPRTSHQPDSERACWHRDKDVGCVQEWVKLLSHSRP